MSSPTCLCPPRGLHTPSFEDLIRIKSASAAFHAATMAILKNAPVDTPIPLLEARQAYPIGLAVAYPLPENNRQLFGLALTLRYPPTPAHSGWLMHAVIREIITLYGHLNAAKTWVGIQENHGYVTLDQFSLLKVHDHTAFFCAFGTHPHNCLSVIVDAENDFVPQKFDLDGFWIPGS